MMVKKRQMHQWSIEKNREEEKLHGECLRERLMNRGRRREGTIFE